MTNDELLTKISRIDDVLTEALVAIENSVRSTEEDEPNEIHVLVSVAAQGVEDLLYYFRSESVERGESLDHVTHWMPVPKPPEQPSYAQSIVSEAKRVEEILNAVDLLHNLDSDNTEFLEAVAHALSENFRG